MYIEVQKKYKKFLNKYFKYEDFIYLFRYISLIITCIFYIIFFKHLLIKKILIILAITFASILLNMLYFYSKDNNGHVKIISIIETLCISLIISQSGGMSSPFIFYIFNTILVVFVIIKNILFCWLTLFVYFISIILSSLIRYNLNISSFLDTQDYYTMLSLVMITLLMQFVVKSYLSLSQKNFELKQKAEELRTANSQIKESLNYIMKMQNILHLFNVKNNKDDIIQQTLEFSYYVSGSKDVVFFEKCDVNNDYKAYSLNNTSYDGIMDYINTNFNLLCAREDIVHVELLCEKYTICIVRHGCEIFGFIIYKENNDKFLSEDMLIFISELTALFFKKIELELLNNELVVNKEQNRIANEIHDGVLQRLFSISCCIFNIYSKIENLDTVDIKKELILIRDSLNSSMKDLRKTIYSLSSKKFGNEIFVEDLKEYINEVQNLNDVKINFEIEGDIQMVSIKAQNAIYRIISESLSNSIRHGHSKNMSLIIHITNNYILAQINDDGSGFNYNEVMQEEKSGLGLKNIQYLVQSLNGKLRFESKINKGTTINISIPLYNAGL